MSTHKGRTPGVDSARRVLNVLLLFGAEKPELTVEEIAERVDISVPSAYRFLSLLRELDLVEENGSNTYALTPRVFALASSAERAFKLGPVLRPVLQELSAETGEAALVIRRVGDHATCAELVQIEHTIRLSFVPGQIMSLHRGAGPKVLLSSMGREWAAHYLDRVRPDATAQSRKSLLDELTVIEEQGWSMSSAEVDEGVWAVAAPVRAGGRTLAALSVAGPQYRIDDARAKSITEAVIAHATAVSQRLTRG
ncbi:IclR family transcriptional regulator [Georgenia sp. EYE_87]|uniref:IclR family transcriptional regulator n=1 Tax=Georgenia sp. EYE_87 TaxID=2853448 RepID=UPI002002C7A6|nr:IclR family transcriptional regulator [Georgenia sp. EYE_87]MCK6210783.1 IclR family transcriptional regulator [Georgenia sp. EYE_87]